jgi:cyclophilin family peptidyl-prolyl cis-trans isomerase
MATENPKVVLETSKGTITIELFEEKAPITVKNFLDYVDSKHYDGLVFHRVISNFMIQGGGYDEQLKERKTKAPIKNESRNGLKNEIGTLAMARTNVADSATSQFFINVRDNSFLNQTESRDGVGYCVFGKVVSGMEVVETIKNVKTSGKGMFDQDCPVDTIVIKSATRG